MRENKMTIRYDYAFPVPESDNTFEEMVCDACSIEWNDNTTQRNGRNGQLQNGLDVFGYPNGPKRRCRGAQAKLRAKGKKLTKKEIDNEIIKAQTSPLNPEELIIVTSTCRDVVLQAYVDQISREQAQNNNFSVKIWFWDDLLERLLVERRFLLKYYKDILSSVTNLAEAEALIDKPIFVLMETCGDINENSITIEHELLMRGVRTYKDRNQAVINGFGPDGIICLYPEGIGKSDDLLMQKFVITIKGWEGSECPIYAVLPNERLAKFKKFYLQENGNVGLIHIHSLCPADLNNNYDMFMDFLSYGYRRRGSLPIIDICCRSMSNLPKSALLDMDWSHLFTAGENWPGQNLWDSKLFPAINDVVKGLISLGKNIQIHYDSRLFLPLALALGYYSHIRIAKSSVWARDAGSSLFTQKLWDSDSQPASITVLPEEVEYLSAQTSQMIVEISLQYGIHSDVKRFVDDGALKYGKWIKISLLEHIHQEALLNASYAIAYANEIGRIVRQNKTGFTDIHLFINTPSPLAFLIGQRLQACGRIHLYWYTNPSYQKAFILQ